MKLLTKYYDALAGKILPYKDFRLFSDLDGGFHPVLGPDWSAKIDETYKNEIMREAETYLDMPYPMTLASDFIRFYRDGNRSIFQDHYYKRRQMVFVLALAEAIEGKGRFADKLMDGIMLICDEPDWVIPAHIPQEYALTPWYRGEHPYLDLFSSETGATLVCVYMLAGTALDAVTPMIGERIKYHVHERVIRSFMENDMWWMGLSGRSVNNWNPWILSNVLLVCALAEEDTSVREQVVDRAARQLDNFINGYHADGGCDEGPSYWGVAGAALFDALELLYDMSGGAIDLFGVELIRRMGEYEADFHIGGSYYVNFADCGPTVNPNYLMIARYGRRVGSERLRDFGVHHAKKMPKNPVSINDWNRYRTLKNLLMSMDGDADYRPARACWYDGICVMTAREFEATDKGFFLACKGGHNAESHNHNDIGSFIVYQDGEPLLLDVGVGTYTKKTFGADRYKIWSMCSDYHNLPTVNGVTQSPGRDFAAKDVVYSAEAHSLSLDIAGAYPETAGLVSLRRTAKLADHTINVRDEIHLKAPGRAVFTLMCGRKPNLDEAGVIRFDGGAMLRYSDGLTAELDDFDITMEDDSIKKNWSGIEIYRVLLRTGTFTDGNFEITLTHE